METQSCDVLDLGSGIWRQFTSDPMLMGQERFDVSVALPMPGKKIYLLSENSVEVKCYSVAEMKMTGTVKNLQLPEKLEGMKSIGLRERG